MLKQLLLLLTVLLSIIALESAILSLGNHDANATTNYNRQDFTIKNFGLNEKGNPFIEVEGQAGKSLPDGDEDFYVYVFYTDKGIFAVTVAEGEEDKPFYSSAQWDQIKHIGSRGDCILSDKNNGDSKLSGHIVEFENPKISFSQVNSGDSICSDRRSG